MAVTGLKIQARLQARVGIATGLVIAGDLIGTGAAQDVVGETPNLAARLQGIAEPNTVVIDDGTRKLLGTLFELSDLGPKDLKGIAQPVRAWAVTRASSVASRFEALHGSGTTCLVGREEAPTASLGEGKEWSGPSGPALGRARHRHIAARGCAP
jgi:hypothetical protein